MLGGWGSFKAWISEVIGYPAKRRLSNASREEPDQALPNMSAKFS